MNTVWGALIACWWLCDSSNHHHFKSQLFSLISSHALFLVLQFLVVLLIQFPLCSISYLLLGTCLLFFHFSYAWSFLSLNICTFFICFNSNCEFPLYFSYMKNWFILFSTWNILSFSVRLGAWDMKITTSQTNTEYVEKLKSIQNNLITLTANLQTETLLNLQYEYWLDIHKPTNTVYKNLELNMLTTTHIILTYQNNNFDPAREHWWCNGRTHSAKHKQQKNRHYLVINS